MSTLAEGQAHIFSTPPNNKLAEKIFRTLIDATPNYGEAYVWLGIALKDQSKLKKACKAFHSAIKFLPTDPRPLIHLGNCLLSLGNYTEAASYLEKGIEMNPAYAKADAMLMLAKVYESQKQIQSAQKLWTDIKNMKSSYPSYDQPMQEAEEKLAIYGLI